MVKNRGKIKYSPRYPYLYPPEQGLALAAQLRKQGFRVTVLRPIRTAQGYAYKVQHGKGY